MAKTESTAVNDLIKIATTQTPLRHDPSDDLMFAAPSTKKERSNKQSALAPRGNDVPLPRAPHGTQELAIAMPALKVTSSAAFAPPLPRATMSSPAIAPPPLPRATLSSPAIAPPPLPRTITPPPFSSPPAAAAAPDFSDATAQVETAPEFLSDSFEALTSTSGPSLASLEIATAEIGAIKSRAPSPSLAAHEPIAARGSRPSLPPPTRAPLPASARMPMPSEYPIVSAVHSQPLAPAPQPTPGVEPVWADDSLDVDVAPFQRDSTAQLAKRRTTRAWMIKLVPLAGAMILLGVVVGSFLVREGQGEKQPAAAATTGTVEVKVVAEAADPVAVAAPAATAPTVDSPAIAAPAAATAPVTEPTPVTEPAPAAGTPPTLATTEPAVTPPNLAATATAPAPVAPAPAAVQEPAMPSITTPAPTAAAIAHRPALVDIRIDSKPAGATVTLVDRGKQTFLGTTPISTAVDPSRAYQVVFSHPRRPTQTAHLDPKAANRLAVVLGRTGTPSTKTELAKPAAPAAVVATPAAARPVAVAKAPVTKIAKPAKLAEPVWDAPVEKPTKATAPAVKIEVTAPVKAETAPATAKLEKAVGGTGTLMISSKPPCEIHVDGKATGLMTPQRSLPLAAGKHKITLVNPGLKIKKSVAVEITANESTKVIQDLTELMP